MKTILLYLIVLLSFSHASSVFHEGDTDYNNQSQLVETVINGISPAEDLLSIINALDYDNLNKGAIIDEVGYIEATNGYEFKRTLSYEITREDNDSPMYIKVWIKNELFTEVIKAEVFKPATNTNPYGELRIDYATLDVLYDNTTNIDFSQSIVNIAALESKILEDKNTLSYIATTTQNPSQSSRNVYIEYTKNYEAKAIIKYNNITQTTSTVEKFIEKQNRLNHQITKYIHDENVTHEDNVTNFTYDTSYRSQNHIQAVEFLLFDYTTGDYLNIEDYNSSSEFQCLFGSYGFKLINFTYAHQSGEQYIGFNFSKDSFADPDEFDEIYHMGNERECKFPGTEQKLYAIKPVFISYEFPTVTENFDLSELKQDDDSLYPIVSEDNIKSIGNKPQ